MERFEIVGTAERLRAVGPAWTGLWKARGALVFQSHAWISAWWDSVRDGGGRRLAIVLAWRGADLVGVLPLATVRRRGLRVLEWAAKDCSDFADALLAPDMGADLLPRMWAHLSGAGGFDLAYLSHLRPEARAGALVGAPSGGVRLRPNHRTEQNWRVCGPFPSGKAWFDGQPKKMRQNHRRGQKFIAERGPMTSRLLAPGADLDDLIGWFIARKRAWLTANGLPPGLFYAEGSGALAAMVRVLDEAGLLRVFVLECDGAPVAASINFVQGGTLMAFVTTYDPDFERASPGLVLMIDYIVWAFDHGLHTVDFLCGDEGFKGRFGTQCLTLGSLMGARTLPGVAAHLLDRGGRGLSRRLAARRTAPAEPRTRPSEDAAA
ncbi:GNAT family N-acetyltransferase [Methylobacterium radiodurans]|uniref:GNAT family N-acetyltransferase n=1 Tax=Methylobacterium radiodurans TaxID=2202828 RepID=A0A2U8VS77_9HYPH|nr:GNAT family N-acetyltransferase [Methylobacterium radiodurans]AWN36557.1 GNAT family N-acetyltransferase [Methylobacterium radiodurans]